MRLAEELKMGGSHPLRTRFLMPLVMVALIAAIGNALPNLVSADDPPEISSDGFESDSFNGGSGWQGDWNTTNSVDIVTDNAPRSGIRHLRMRGWSSLQRDINLSGPTNVELGFWAKANSLEDGDIVTLEVSQDGNSWTVLGTWADGDDDDEYRRYQYDLSELGLSGQVFLRFRGDSDDASDYFFIDEVSFSGESVDVDDPPAASPPDPPSPEAPLNLSSIVIDGLFDDWDGYPSLPDPAGDASKARGDLSSFSWANNGGSEVNYWMIERYPNESLPDYEDDDEEWDNWSGWGIFNSNSQARKVRYIIYVDTDNDGLFDEWDDRRVFVYYRPHWADSDVRVKVKRGSTGHTLFSSNGDWGDSITEGGRRVEIEVPWERLGINNGDVIRMYVKSDRNDRLPDSGDVQWSPASILGYWLLASLLAVAATVFWRMKRKREASCPSG